MIINQLNSTNALSDATVTSKDILYNKIAYGPDGKLIGNAPISIDNNIDGKTTLSKSADWHSVCYGNGKFVAVASSSNIASYSTDGITWTSVTISSSSAQWYSVCYGNGKFVAVAYSGSNGSNIAAYSTDGINWTQTTLPVSAHWSSVCYGNGKYVAISGLSSSDSIAAYLIANKYSIEMIN